MNEAAFIRKNEQDKIKCIILQSIDHIFNKLRPEGKVKDLLIFYYEK